MAKLKVVSKLHGVHYLSVDPDDFHVLFSFVWIIKKDYKNGRFYAHAHVGDKKYTSLHREILKPKIGYLIDHINGDGLDCRKSNLRHATSSQNQMNRTVGKKGYKGIIIDELGRYRVRIMANGVMHHGGKRYSSLQDAMLRYNEMAKELHGEFSLLNKV